MQKEIEYYNQKVIELIIMVAEIMNKKYLEVYDTIAEILKLDDTQEEYIKNIITDYLIESNRTTFFKNVDEEKLSSTINCSRAIAKTIIFESFAIDLAEQLNEKAYGKGSMFGFTNKIAKEQGLLIEYAIMSFINGGNVNKIANIVQEVLRNNDFGNFEIAAIISLYFNKNISNILSQVEKSNCICKNYIMKVLKENDNNMQRKENEV